MAQVTLEQPAILSGTVADHASTALGNFLEITGNQ